MDNGIVPPFSNLKIELLVSAEPHITTVMGEKTNAPVIGLLIDETLDVTGAPMLAVSPTNDLYYYTEARV